MKLERANILRIVLATAAVLYAGYRVYLWRMPYEWSGTIEARTISVGSRAGGRIKEILVKEGDLVKAGQSLVVLEPGDLIAQRLAAAGQVAQAQANLDKLERGARPEEIQQAKARAMNANAALAESKAGARQEQIAAADARLQAAQSTAEKATVDAQRMRQLFASGAAAQAELDQAEMMWKSATAQRDAAKQNYDELKNGVRREQLMQAQARAMEAQASANMVVSGSRVEDIQAARGALDATKGKLDAINLMIDELTIRAPRDSRIESLDLRPGDIVAPNATCATLIERDQLYVRIYVPETQLGHLHGGQDVPVYVDSFPGRAWKGVVEHINNIGEYTPRNLQTADERADQVFAARVGLREGLDQLQAGMAAFIRVPK